MVRYESQLIKFGGMTHFLFTSINYWLLRNEAMMHPRHPLRAYSFKVYSVVSESKDSRDD